MRNSLRLVLCCVVYAALVTQKLSAQATAGDSKATEKKPDKKASIQQLVSSCEGEITRQLQGTLRSVIDEIKTQGIGLPVP